MNRRDFLGLLRVLAFLPFIKLPATSERPAVAETLTDSEVEEIRRVYEGLKPDDTHAFDGHIASVFIYGEALSAERILALYQEQGEAMFWAS